MDALQGLRNGQRIFIGSGCAQPQHLVSRLADAVDDLYDIEIVHLLTIGAAPYTDPKFAGHVRHNAFFIGPNVREAVERGDADYTPANLSDIPSFFESGLMRLDWALIQVSPPDRHGFCSLGVSVDVVRAAVRAARRVVAQVNPRMPRTHGDSQISVKDINVLVEHEEPLLELPPPPVDDTADRIGRYIAGLIGDGSTIQAGIGAIPNAALKLLTARRDLGVHTEMMSDWVVDLLEADALAPRRRIVTSFAMGTRRLYDAVDDNPRFAFRGNEYVNDPFVIAQHPKMISINSALQVDLTGQVCADSIGTRFYSGIGGQVDFVRGATHSKGGKSIIALPSTARDGTVSRIVPVLAEGAGVVTSRADVHYVVTEYGIAELRGRSIRERALALVGVAHPKYRDELMAAARARRVIPAAQPKPRATAYPVELESALKLKDGTAAAVRPIRAADEDLLRELFYSHSERTIYFRYGMPLRRLPPDMIHKLVNIDYDREMALAAFDGEPPAERMIAVGRYYADPDGGLAEVALTVHDDFQGRGLGTALFKRVCDLARGRGLRGLYGFVHVNNPRMIRVFHAAGLPLQTEMEGTDAYRLTLRFEG